MTADKQLAENIATRIMTIWYLTEKNRSLEREVYNPPSREQIFRTLVMHIEAILKETCLP